MELKNYYEKLVNQLKDNKSISNFVENKDEEGYKFEFEKEDVCFEYLLTEKMLKLRIIIDCPDKEDVELLKEGSRITQGIKDEENNDKYFSTGYYGQIFIQRTYVIKDEENLEIKLDQELADIINLINTRMFNNEEEKLIKIKETPIVNTDIRDTNQSDVNNEIISENIDRYNEEILETKKFNILKQYFEYKDVSYEIENDITSGVIEYNELQVQCLYDFKQLILTYEMNNVQYKQLLIDVIDEAQYAYELDEKLENIMYIGQSYIVSNADEIENSIDVFCKGIKRIIEQYKKNLQEKEFHNNYSEDKEHNDGKNLEATDSVQHVSSGTSQNGTVGEKDKKIIIEPSDEESLIDLPNPSINQNRDKKEKKHKEKRTSVHNKKEKSAQEIKKSSQNDSYIKQLDDLQANIKNVLNNYKAELAAKEKALERKEADLKIREAKLKELENAREELDYQMLKEENQKLKELLLKLQEQNNSIMQLIK